ncbi:MAG TPA: hypothetical protein VLJ39_18160 [Tepidisphaeraceae bacterium]|nr:hypothetical protein [Tepidisphaeraceae bacterium]
MPFDANAYGPDVASIISESGMMPLLRRSGLPAPSDSRITRVQIPESARAGLYLYSGSWDQAHDIAQTIPTADGSYWHAIVHRQEPDPGNAAYWFRQVGEHPIFPALAKLAAVIEPEFGPNWNPFAFIDYCEKATATPGTQQEPRAVKIQQIEWELLFDYCVRSATRG